MKLINFIALFLIGTVVFASGKNPKVENYFQGQVIFSSTKNPASNLTIWINGNPTKTKTDQYGKFQFNTKHEIKTIAFSETEAVGNIVPFPVDTKHDNGTTFYIIK